jgi:hypothetical protein
MAPPVVKRIAKDRMHGIVGQMRDYPSNTCRQISRPTSPVPSGLLFIEDVYDHSMTIKVTTFLRLVSQCETILISCVAYTKGNANVTRMLRFLLEGVWSTLNRCMGRTAGMTV